MATINRYWFVKRNKLGFVQDYNGSGQQQTRNGVVPRYQSLTTSNLSIRYDAVIKNPHFDSTTIPTLANNWHYEGSNALDQAPIFPSQFHEAIVYKAIALGYEMTAELNVEKAGYFHQKYDEIVKKAKTFARRYYNGGTMRINPIDF